MSTHKKWWTYTEKEADHFGALTGYPRPFYDIKGEHYWWKWLRIKVVNFVWIIAYLLIFSLFLKLFFSAWENYWLRPLLHISLVLFVVYFIYIKSYEFFRDRDLEKSWDKGNTKNLSAYYDEIENSILWYKFKLFLAKRKQKTKG
jgi:hypothetical protein